jgi:Uma2 family endonuclease
MGLPAGKQAEIFTYADYQGWDDKERWEIINGEAYNMTPAPNRKHQTVSRELVVQIGNQLKGKTCEVYHAPFDVRLRMENEKEEDIKNIVQPDISVICDKNKLDEKGCLGSPDLIIEIISPSTSRKDRKEKFHLYEQAGVNEYWLISPEDKIVQIFILGENGEYGRPKIYDGTHTVPFTAVNNVIIDLKTIFEAVE